MPLLAISLQICCTPLTEGLLSAALHLDSVIHCAGIVNLDKVNQAHDKSRQSLLQSRAACISSQVIVSWVMALLSVYVQDHTDTRRGRA